jgi:alpha-aminoadipic semialdehyde synthase
MHLLGIRREDKNLFEKRVPLVPDDVRALAPQARVIVQPAPRRIFSDDAYRAAGATLGEDLASCPVILGVKEIPPQLFLAGKAYVFFSHTMKGQPQNMPMLRRLLELGCTLIDYEKIVDDQGRRLVFFGRHAGLAGMIDTLWALGKRLAHEGIQTPLDGLRPAHAYASLDEAKAEIAAAGRTLRAALRPGLQPLTFGVTGYGNVSSGAQEILDLLAPRAVPPEELPRLPAAPEIYKTVFYEKHLVEPTGSGAFELQDYYPRPRGYRPVFDRYLDHLDVIVNCIYWEPRYPRLVTLEDLGRLYGGDALPRLRVIGDITCDIDGSIQANVRSTASDNPVYVYDVKREESVDGVDGRGPVILAVDNLPAELPLDASLFFSQSLRPFAPALAGADYGAPLARSGLPPALQRATIVYRGELTEPFAYLAAHLR